MNSVRQNIGIDVASRDFKVVYGGLLENQNFKVFASHTFKNTAKGIEDFLEWIDKWHKKRGQPDLKLHLTLEPTGVYHEHLAYALYEQGYTLHLVLPNQASKYSQSLGNKSKTDGIDAKILARMGVERQLRSWQPISSQLKKLKNLTRERAQRIVIQVQVQNQLHALTNTKEAAPESISRNQQLYQTLQDQVKEIEKEIDQLIEQDPALADKINKLTSIKGVGKITATTVVAETDGFAAFTSIKQLQSYSGYDIKIRQSGQWKGKEAISKQGNSRIREVMYMAARSAITHNQEFKNFNQRLINKGKHSMVANTAVQRKLLVLIYTLWKKDQYYDPEFYKKQGHNQEKTTKSPSKENQNKNGSQQKFAGNKHRVMPEPESSFGLPLNKKQWTLRPTALDKHRFNDSPYVFLRL